MSLIPNQSAKRIMVPRLPGFCTRSSANTRLESGFTEAIFDFGISTEQGGRYLNEGLIFQKEGFGARTVVYDTYELNIES